MSVSVLKRYSFGKTIVVGVRIQENKNNEEDHARICVGNSKSDIKTSFCGSVISKDCVGSKANSQKVLNDVKSLPQRSSSRSLLKEVPVGQNKNNRTAKNQSKVQKQTKPFLCNICNKLFSQECTLNRHMRSHDDKPFRCDTCSKSFARKQILISHLQTHSERKSFQCEVCNKSFSQKPHLVNHRFTHSEVKLFHCDVCIISFPRKGDLVKHMLIHSKKKSFCCNVCNKVFLWKRDLVKHRSVH